MVFACLRFRWVDPSRPEWRCIRMLACACIIFFVRVEHETKSVSSGNKHSFIHHQILPKFVNQLFTKGRTI